MLRLWPVWVLAAAGCTGSIAGGGGSGGGLGGTGGGDDLTNCVADPGPLLMRRLTNAEYQASASWLLGIDASAEVALFPADLKRTGFDNAFELQTVSTSHADRYHAAAKSLTDRVFGNATKRDALIGCNPASCMRAFVASFGRKAFRRPLAADEVDRYAAVAATETNPYDGAQLAVRALLESPSFLWRVEIGESVPDSTNLKLTGLEMASRLSFFLFSAPPDDALLAAAERGDLDTAEGIEARARLMLEDPRAAAAFERFSDMLFGVDRLATVSRTASSFPAFDDATKASMRSEVHQLFSKHLWSSGTPLLDLYVTKQGHVDAKLAAVYGVPAPASGWQDVDWGSDPNRGGLFTTAGLLTLTARNDFTSPIQRGLYIRDTILCEKIAPPLGGIPPISVMPGETQAAAESRHTSDPACTGCHLRIDPVGLGLERYDAVGAVRTQYPDGKPVPLTGKVAGLEQPDYAGGVELGQLMRAAPQAERCAVQHTFRWAMARMEEKQVVDACSLEQVARRFAGSGQSFRELVVALATNDAFRFRRPAD